MLDRRWWICRFPRLHWWEMIDLGPRQHGDIHRLTCHNAMCLAACRGLLMDSQSLFGNGAFSDLAMVKARHLLWCSSWRRRR
jgi:hypothetical protein